MCIHSQAISPRPAVHSSRRTCKCPPTHGLASHWCSSIIPRYACSAMDAVNLRAWWFHRQGLDGSTSGSTPAEVLGQTDWARSVAGSGPYLTFFARAGLSREAVDRAVADLEIHELPSARGCTYVLPAVDFALGLRVGAEFSSAEMVVARKLGVTDAEISKLCSDIVDALRKGPMSPDEIRDATGKASRSLGPEGAKKGALPPQFRLHWANCRRQAAYVASLSMRVSINSVIVTRFGSRAHWRDSGSPCLSHTSNSPAATFVGFALRRWLSSSGSRGWV